MEPAPDGAHLNHNCIQVVGADECGQRPHTDSRAVCRFAAVLYLNPNVPDDVRHELLPATAPRRAARREHCAAAPHEPRDALGTRYVPHGSFAEDMRVPHRFNRLLVYRANLLHSATAYFGRTLEEKRMAAVFFWMAKA